MERLRENEQFQAYGGGLLFFAVLVYLPALFLFILPAFNSAWGDPVPLSLSYDFGLDITIAFLILFFYILSLVILFILPVVGYYLSLKISNYKPPKVVYTSIPSTPKSTENSSVKATLKPTRVSSWQFLQKQVDKIRPEKRRSYGFVVGIISTFLTFLLILLFYPALMWVSTETVVLIGSILGISFDIPIERILLFFPFILILYGLIYGLFILIPLLLILALFISIYVLVPMYSFYVTYLLLRKPQNLAEETV